VCESSYAEKAEDKICEERFAEAIYFKCSGK